MPNSTDDHHMESILASRVSKFDEEISGRLNSIEIESSAILADEQELAALDRQMQELQARKNAVLAARQEKFVRRAEHSNRIQIVENRKVQIAKALRDLKAVMEDDV